MDSEPKFLGCFSARKYFSVIFAIAAIFWIPFIFASGAPSISLLSAFFIILAVGYFFEVTSIILLNFSMQLIWTSVPLVMFFSTVFSASAIDLLSNYIPIGTSQTIVGGPIAICFLSIALLVIHVWHLTMTFNVVMHIREKEMFRRISIDNDKKYNFL